LILLVDRLSPPAFISRRVEGAAADAHSGPVPAPIYFLEICSRASGRRRRFHVLVNGVTFGWRFHVLVNVATVRMEAPRSGERGYGSDRDFMFWWTWLRFGSRFHVLVNVATVRIEIPRSGERGYVWMEAPRSGERGYGLDRDFMFWWTWLRLVVADAFFPLLFENPPCLLRSESCDDSPSVPATDWSDTRGNAKICTAITTCWKSM